ncbi:helix-turn-helix domain-containing protein [Arthrobacter sp. FW306-2-2C-D06B]|uniref:helix-turn-helix domain-containing protein n=1 Tax=Arthrobacter sp. FW306-2-2C-D06B TaxID=2879618 RepID=UPI001F1CEF28|nr:helix-turn-helix domain-containing protein [Arthrobacter sp. FW306-2-2C-D06B]UKA60610.1 helix-turn-helix domain-containing protein [Arthrobacter sp. FW306-2-2C-D06B]
MALSVPELAKRLHVNESRARLLVRSGRIPAQMVGGQWIIDEADAAKYRAGGPSGRPLSERSAWQLLKHARNHAVHKADDPDLSPVERHRLNQRLQRLQESPDPLTLLNALLAKRAEKQEFYSNPADLSELREDPRLRLSGVSHPDSGLLSGSELEAYVSRKDFNGLVRDWFLVNAAIGQRANIVLHIADDVPEELPRLLVAADLAERPGVRERNAALDIIRSIRAD